MGLAIDLLLALGVVGLAVEIAAGRTLFRSIVMFVVFGLVMALVWARLGAPDLALAEAALGSGITGALLLISYRRTRAARSPAARRGTPASRLALPLAAGTAALVAVLGTAAVGLPRGEGSAGAQALAEMPRQPVDNPVTAVLLLFRGYDTLLETAVLLAACLGARLVRAPAAPAPAVRLPLVGALLSVVLPMAVLVSGHLLHAGGNAPGGAFQAGAVLAAAGVLLVLTGRLVPTPEPPPWQRLVLVAAVVVFSALGLAAVPLGGAPLELPGKWAIYLVETTMLLSIALPLVLMFAAGGGVGRTP